MGVSMKSVIAFALPVLGTIIGLIWYRRRKGQDLLDYPKPPDKVIPPKTEALNEEKQVEESIKPIQATQVNALLKSDGLNIPSLSGLPNAGFTEEYDSSVTSSEESPVTEVEIHVAMPKPLSVESLPNTSENFAKNVHASQHDDHSQGNNAVCNTQNDLSETSVLSKDITETTVTNSKQFDTDSVVSNSINVNSSVSSTEQDNSRPTSTSELEPECSETNNNCDTNDTVSSVMSKSWADSMEEEQLGVIEQTESQADGGSSAVENHLEQSTRSADLNSEKPVTKHPTEKSSSVKDDEKVDVDVVDALENEVSNSLSNCQGPTEVDMMGSSDSPQSHNSIGSSDNGSQDHDAASQVSADSGHGGSMPETSSPVTVPLGAAYVVYEFDFPTDHCGMLIGKYGRNINKLKEQTGVEISVKRKVYTQEYQLVCMEGLQSQIDRALSILRDRFPVKKFPHITLEPAQQECPVLFPEMMQLSLPEGVNVDCLVSSVVAPNHVFLQQPTHPSFHMLERLNQLMNTCYSQDAVPQLPRPIEVGVICSAPMYNTGWYRAQVVQSYPESDEVDIKYVDYGGYMTVQGSLLRQIRSDFSSLPFQSVECFLANVMPPKGVEVFPMESVAYMEQIVQNKLLQAQVVGHEENGIPYIQLYDVQEGKLALINRELVNSGLAQWIEHLL